MKRSRSTGKNGEDLHSPDGEFQYERTSQHVVICGEVMGVRTCVDLIRKGAYVRTASYSDRRHNFTLRSFPHSATASISPHLPTANLNLIVP